MLPASWVLTTSTTRRCSLSGGCSCRPRGVESWTVVGLDVRAVGVVDEFLGWLTEFERSPNTVEAYARDLGSSGRSSPRAGWVGIGCGVGAGRVRGVGAPAGGERAGALRAGGQAVGVDGQPDARGVVGSTSSRPARDELARDLVVRTRSGRGAYKPFLHGIARARPRGRPVRLPERRRLPRTLGWSRSRR